MKSNSLKWQGGKSCLATGSAECGVALNRASSSCRVVRTVANHHTLPTWIAPSKNVLVRDDVAVPKNCNTHCQNDGECDNLDL